MTAGNERALFELARADRLIVDAAMVIATDRPDLAGDPTALQRYLASLAIYYYELSEQAGRGFGRRPPATSPRPMKIHGEHAIDDVKT